MTRSAENIMEAHATSVKGSFNLFSNRVNRQRPVPVCYPVNVLRWFTQSEKEE